MLPSPMPSREDTHHAPDVLQRGVGLSDVDRKLIGLLQADGRTPFVDLARATGIREKAVRQRVQELRDSGVIHITAVSSPEVLGYSTIAMIGLRCRGEAPSAVAAKLAAVATVDYVIVSTGRFNLFVEVFCRSLPDMRETLEREILPMPGIEGVEVFPYLRLPYQEGVFEVGGSAPGVVSPPPEPPEQIDREIVAQLSTDGRMSLHTVARNLGVSEAQVRRRLQRLRDSGAVRVMAITNPMTLGFETIALAGLRVSSGSSVRELADVLAGIPQVSYVAVCAGRYDILVELVCQTLQELDTLLDERMRRLAGVSSIEPHLYLGLLYKPLGPAGRGPESTEPLYGF
jgi:Lrp/AsnC family transcriptional regulator for asnA, asnC and gidA